MTLKEKVAKVKEMLRLAFAEEPAAGDTTPADSLKEHTTADGAKVQIDKLEVGGKAYMEDGTTPLTAGVTLSDGTNIAVDEAGVITAVTAPVEAAAEPEADPAVPALPAGFMERFAAMEQELADLKARDVQKFAEQTEAHKNAYEARAQKFQDALTQVLDLVQQFADQPAADPVQVPTGKGQALSKLERAKAFKEAITSAGGVIE